MSMQEGTWQRNVLDKYYFSRTEWLNGRAIFNRLIIRNVESCGSILEIGAGPTNKTTSLLASLGNVTGLDIDPAVKTNVHCQQTKVYDGIHIPYEDGSFDLAISDYVCEHIQSPLQVMREINRVLRPAGLYIFRTPNLWHYVSLVAKFTPYWFHHWIANRARNLPTESHEPYPTYYRMNTRRTCRRILKATGFDIKVYETIETEPSYAMASRLFFYPLMVWERLLNSSSWFEGLRVNILCVAKKKES